ncbi:MAG TPA: hypothetical protein DCF93_08455 [Desulfuromonas sp.]|nr:hypothetical protein [Desulfuromonas sp.]
MGFDADIHHRQSIRLRDYDYAAVGAYFVTICTQGRECLFGDIAEGVMRPNMAGGMVAEVWQGLPTRFPQVARDEFVVMPNHFHGILILTDPPAVGAPLVGARSPSTPDVGAPLVGAQDHDRAETRRAGTRPAPCILNE